MALSMKILSFGCYNFLLERLVGHSFFPSIKFICFYGFIHCVGAGRSRIWYLQNYGLSYLSVNLPQTYLRTLAYNVIHPVCILIKVGTSLFLNIKFLEIYGAQFCLIAPGGQFEYLF